MENHNLISIGKSSTSGELFSRSYVKTCSITENIQCAFSSWITAPAKPTAPGAMGRRPCWCTSHGHERRAYDSRSGSRFVLTESNCSLPSEPVGHLGIPVGPPNSAKRYPNRQEGSCLAAPHPNNPAEAASCHVPLQTEASSNIQP